MMSLHSSTHSSQMKTDGPAISLRTLVLGFAAKRTVEELAVLVLAAGVIAHVDVPL